MSEIIPNSPEFARLPVDSQRYILRLRAADQTMRDRRTALFYKEMAAKHVAEFLITLDSVDITAADLDKWDLQKIVGWVETMGYTWAGAEWELECKLVD